MSPLTSEQDAWLRDVVSEAVRPLCEEVVRLRAENARLRLAVELTLLANRLR